MDVEVRARKGKEMKLKSVAPGIYTALNENYCLFLKGNGWHVYAFNRRDRGNGSTRQGYWRPLFKRPTIGRAKEFLAEILEERIEEN